VIELSKSLAKIIQTHIKPTDEVLSLGVGIGNIVRHLTCKHIVGLDAFEPYLYCAKKYCETILWDLNTHPLPFETDSFDVVFGLDIIEHLEKDVGLKLIDEVERITKRTAIFFTPEGFLTQTGDAWHLGGERWQEHRSGWDSYYFKDLGYKIQMYPGDKAHDRDYEAFIAWKDLK